MPKGYFLSEVDVADPGAYVIAERRQTDTGILMLLNTSKRMAECPARRLRL